MPRGEADIRGAFPRKGPAAELSARQLAPSRLRGELGMWHIVTTMFSWPNGIVVGNLLASLLWAAPALLHLHRKLDRHHRERNPELVWVVVDQWAIPDDGNEDAQIISLHLTEGGAQADLTPESAGYAGGSRERHYFAMRVSS